TKSSKIQGINQLVRVVRKLALALEEAHKHQVIHRDLKPANVMIDERKDPVVMDFGLARRSTENEKPLTHSGTVIGTPAYMSPEQVDGDNSRVGPPADIYSLGVIFYELLTGQLPFEGSLMSILRQIATVEPTPPAELREDTPPKLEAICLKMMAKQIEDRYQSMGQVAADLTEFLKDYKSATEESSASDVAADEQSLLETSGVPSIPSPVESTGVTIRPRPKKQTPRKRSKKKAIAENSVVTPLDQEKARIEDLIRRGELSLALKALEELAARKEPEARELAMWARGEIPRVRALPKKIRRELPGTIATARQMIRMHDYAQAADLLRSVPKSLRTPDVITLLEEATDLHEETELLIEEITDAVEKRRLSGLEDRVDRLRTLRPGHRLAKRLKKSLRSYGGRQNFRFDRGGNLLPSKTSGLEEYWKIGAGVFAVVFALVFWGFLDYLNSDSESHSGLTGSETGTGDSEVGDGSKPRTTVGKTASGEVSLFNGVDLTGWTPVEDATAWRVDNGVLVSDSGERGVLWLNKSYSDFELRFRFRLGSRANSGIYLRSADRLMASGGDQLEIQLLDDPKYPTQPGHGLTGAIYGLKAPDIRAYQSEQWNEMTIRLAGRLLEVTLNGRQIQKVSLDDVTQQASTKTGQQPGLKAASGYIGIQTYGTGISRQSRIEFADLTIVDLTELPERVAQEKGDWSIPLKFTDAKPVSEINRGDPINAYASLSQDGLDIYWTREGSSRKSEIRTASRSREGAPFGASTKVVEGRHGVIAADGQYIVYLADGADGVPALMESFRDSRYQSFPPASRVFTESRLPKSPSLSIDGKTIVFQRSGANPGTTDLVIGMRNRYDLPWSGPWTLRLDSPAWLSDQVTWPFLSEDRLTLLFCNGGGRDPKLIRATRPDEQSEFPTFEHITVDGLQIMARAPHYVYRTRELYYSVPIDNPAGSWEIWRARAK
ncbi:MAG: DUF1080 domain-containing protein, partial [Planctomycetota bacterium]|nr:DUF1080 domain-containing protein [Planctomycetota bacterium]